VTQKGSQIEVTFMVADYQAMNWVREFIEAPLSRAPSALEGGAGASWLHRFKCLSGPSGRAHHSSTPLLQYSISPR
jgi:hypothetical protein